MTDDRTRVLTLLAEGKIDVAEAERLLGALGADRAEAVEPELVPDDDVEVFRRRPVPKYLRVECLDGAKTVNVRVPLQLLRSGMKLTSLLPEDAQGKVADALSEKGFPENLEKMSDENVDDFLRMLGELTVDVRDGDETVRVYCE